MARNYRQGKYVPLNPNKIIGDIDKIVYRSSWEKVVMTHFDVSSSVVKWGSEVIVIPYRSPKDNKLHRYFIDFIIVTKNSKDKYIVTLIEVKPDSQTKIPRRGTRKSDKTYLNEGITYLVNQQNGMQPRNIVNQKVINSL